MAIKQEDGYACSVCGKLYPDPTKADSCRDSHEIVYIPLRRSDLNRLLNFIYLRDESLLTESLVETLRKYQFKGKQ